MRPARVKRLGGPAQGTFLSSVVAREAERDPEDCQLRSIKPDLEVGITVGAGHFHQLEVPDQINAMIERFLATTL